MEKAKWIELLKEFQPQLELLVVIYESRPNVTSDVATLCFKSGNAVILKGGSEAYNSNKILCKFISEIS